MLFEDLPLARPATEGLTLLPGFALPVGSELIRYISDISSISKFRNMMTPGGFTMSVAMTNCGAGGWVTDRKGYRYTADDPETGNPWPAMPPLFSDLAGRAAKEAGFPDFAPDACLVNRYEPGARMSLHQDRNERDFTQPIVSVSLGLPVTFLFGGTQRSDRPAKIPLIHGDVAVWGGPTRLNFHGVAPLEAGEHPGVGALRYNLTFRRAL